MSYQVIARKWRPQTFTEVVGQNHITQTLKNSLQQDRLPHALLFTGPRGTGKTSSARILAKALRCQQAVDFQPCNTCPSCLEITNGSSVDVIEIDGASNNGVDSIRELRDTVAFMPSSGKIKAYIIDEVHMLSTSAFNALLKTLEEPPSHVVFIMATTEVHKIPQTILSRCQRFDFRRIPTRQITDRLKLICETDGFQATEEALWVIARQGDGSLRDSQSLLDQVISFANGPLTQEKVVEILGLTHRELINDTLQAFVQRDLQLTIQIIQRLAQTGVDPLLFCREILEQLRNFLVLKMAGNESHGLIDLPDSEIQNLKNLGENASEEDIHLLFDMTLKASQDIHRALEPYMTLEVSLFRISQAPRVEKLQSLIDRLQTQSGFGSSESPKAYVPPVKPIATSAQQKIKEAQKVPLIPKGLEAMKASLDKALPKANPVSAQTTPAPSVEDGPAPAPVRTNVDQTIEDSEQWLQFIDLMRQRDALFAAKIENLLFVKKNQKLLTLSIPPKSIFLKDTLTDPNVRKKLQGFIDSLWGDGYSFEVISGKSELGGETAQQLSQKKVQLAEQELYQKASENPLVRQVNEVFETEIKSITELKK